MALKKFQQARLFVKTVYCKYDKHFLSEDPISLVHSFSDSKDQEVVGLVAALLSFGNAKSIIASVKRVLDGDLNTKHRWVTSADLKLLLHVLKTVVEHHGSIKNFFLEGYHDNDPDISKALDSFSKRIKKMAGHKRTRGFDFLFPSPKDKSPCKRLNMYLRWMARPVDGIDLGLWKEVSPSQLIIPLDTHVYQFARKFGLSRYKNPNWQMACDVTRFLKSLDPKDPIKYDFAICHYGMENGWKKL